MTTGAALGACATIVAIVLKVDACAAAVGQAFLAREATFAVVAYFSGGAYFAAAVAVVAVGQEVDAESLAVG